MFGIQPIHLLVIVVVALIIFGPKRLPEMGRSIAKAFREFRSGVKEMGDGFHEEIEKPASSPVMPQPAAVSPNTGQSASTTDRFCTRCGSANLAESRFCH